MLDKAGLIDYLSKRQKFRQENGGSQFNLTYEEADYILALLLRKKPGKFRREVEGFLDGPGDPSLSAAPDGSGYVACTELPVHQAWFGKTIEEAIEWHHRDSSK